MQLVLTLAFTLFSLICSSPSYPDASATIRDDTDLLPPSPPNTIGMAK